MGRNCAAHSSPVEGSLHQQVHFDEFFEEDLSEEKSPFLTANSRLWAKNLPLRASLLAAALLVLSWSLTFSEGYLPLIHLLLLVVYFISGVPALIDSLEDLLSFKVNIDVLMTLAAFSSVLIGSPMEGALLLVLFDLAGSIESAVTAKTRSALHSLHKLAPTAAHVVDESGRTHLKAVRDVTVGTLIRIRAGEIVPLDGEIIEGASFVSLVHLTGESKPIPKKAGETIEAGARTIEGAIILRVTHTSSDSTLSRIIKLITDANQARPALQRWFDGVSRRYALSIIGLSGFFALLLPFVQSLPFLGPDGSVYRALAFLIAASPCALIIALPTAYLSAISACARKGILLKGGITLDAIAACETFAFDKTGTLTTGILQVAEISVSGTEADELDLLSVASALERGANHPIADAIRHYAEEKKAEQIEVANFKVIPGSGVQGDVSWQGKTATAYVGNRSWISSLTDLSFDQEERGSVAYLLIDQTICQFRFRDEIRDGMDTTLLELKQKHGINSLMLTGDNWASARSVAHRIGLDEFRAELSPEDKLRIVSDLADQKGVAMVGDGINDAPSLARATVGISMGAFGSATAIDASDAVLLQDNISLLGWLIKRARKTKRIVRQNLILAAGVIICTSVPALLGFVPLGLAVVLHEGGTVLVGLNGLRLLRS